MNAAGACVYGGIIGIRCPGAGITGGSEPHGGCWEMNSSPPEEKYVPLAAEPSPHS